jgi:DNA primase large subunit
MSFTQDEDIRVRSVRLLKGFYTANKHQLKDVNEKAIENKIKSAAMLPNAVSKIKKLVTDRLRHKLEDQSAA